MLSQNLQYSNIAQQFGNHLYNPVFSFLFIYSTEYNTLLEKHRDWMLQSCSILVSVGETALLADSLAPPQGVLANHPACV